ncbi:hypothetical protein COU37_05225 [Candidatus Micrarchaeota archaeon CG10_big_fil_rev_8_21_14_0_10_45_29]|nr:MAG: hypothetical protein COU37_05225 [Candidatus Micrarchaeota archaeon CG10_big_fil_rev_8_21_14_0_10_45_29]
MAFLSNFGGKAAKAIVAVIVPLTLYSCSPLTSNIRKQGTVTYDPSLPQSANKANAYFEEGLKLFLKDRHFVGQVNYSYSLLKDGEYPSLSPVFLDVLEAVTLAAGRAIYLQLAADVDSAQKKQITNSLLDSYGQTWESSYTLHNAMAFMLDNLGFKTALVEADGKIYTKIKNTRFAGAFYHRDCLGVECLGSTASDEKDLSSSGVIRLLEKSPIALFR